MNDKLTTLKLLMKSILQNMHIYENIIITDEYKNIIMSELVILKDKINDYILNAEKGGDAIEP